MKVSGNREDDIERLRAVRDAVGKETVIIVDANTGEQLKYGI